MASRPWTDEDREFLKKLAYRRDWIDSALGRFPERTEAAIRSMMQKVRIDLGMSDQRFVDAPWMADAVNGSRMLYERLSLLGLRP